MGLTGFNRARREAAARVAASVAVEPERAPAQSKKLNQMNKAELLEYGASIGLALDSKKTNKELLAAIQEHEAGNKDGEASD